MSESTSRIKLILEDYYREAYTEVLYNKSFLSLGVNYFHKQVEKHWNDSTSIQKQLEINTSLKQMQ